MEVTGELPLDEMLETGELHRLAPFPYRQPWYIGKDVDRHTSTSTSERMMSVS